ncbi:Hypothetical protein CINCED_3A001151 [Cinara cedri]|uniref:Uncharacterized protein n=1 Tax=Cinara cedri TaxID=506608 RepID=A0A5E4NIX0_9HEMI|nr:Hypothetical protein CINCED_3A001151 [Cinara cedri]
MCSLLYLFADFFRDINIDEEELNNDTIPAKSKEENAQAPADRSEHNKEIKTPEVNDSVPEKPKDKNVQDKEKKVVNRVTPSRPSRNLLWFIPTTVSLMKKKFAK